MINGNCTGDKNPDWWFPELPPYKPTLEKLKAVAEQTNYALKLCASCPVKQECLAEGMQTDMLRGGVYEKHKPDRRTWGNLPHGIWGGLMAAERLELVGIRASSYPPRSRALPVRAFDLYRNLKPLLRR